MKLKKPTFRWKALVIALGFLPILLLHQNCRGVIGPQTTDGSNPALLGSGGTDVGNPLTFQSVTFSSYDHLAAPIADTSATICIRKIMFLEGEESSGPEKQIFTVGESHIMAQGQKILDLELKKGAYEKIEILIKNECGDNKSGLVRNQHGDFATHEDIELKFSGDFNITQDSIIELGIEELVIGLSGVKSDEEIRQVFFDHIGDIAIK